MANFDISAFDEEFDDYLNELEDLADEGFIARCEAALVAYEAAVDIEIETAWLKELERRHG